MKKKPTSVAKAEELAKLKKEELDAARAAVRRIEGELGEALAAVRSARKSADAGLPQCKMVHVRWRNSAESDLSDVAILRRTPGGVLVVRRLGDSPGMEFRFKFNAYRDVYAQAEKRHYFGSNHRELRDVPAEFLPAGALAST